MWRAVSFLSVGMLLVGCDPGLWNPGSGSASVGSFTSVGWGDGTGWGEGTGGADDIGEAEDTGGGPGVGSSDTDFSGSASTGFPGFPERCEGEVGEAGGSFDSCEFIHWCGDRSFELTCRDGWCSCVEDGRYAGECRMEQQCAAIQSSHFNPFAPVVANCCDWGGGPGGSTSSTSFVTTWQDSSDDDGGWASATSGADPTRGDGGWVTTGADPTRGDDGDESGPWRPR